MDTDTVWRHADAQRLQVAALLESLDEAQWEVPSLCSGWRVREVGAHLTLAHMGPGQAMIELARARGSFDRMIHDTARRAARRPTAEYAVAVRAMVGSRRKAPGVSAVEPLTDALVHALDIAVPLGLDLAVDPEAAAVSATRCYEMGFPFHARRRLRGLRLRATDHDLLLGDGVEVAGPVQDLLLLVTGRTRAALPRLHGDEGLARLSR